ncbi:GspE/PulE family protein [Fusibacter ferrireducens]|uniref:Type II/IV secretion system protein n=1 Tax=Fusibacter ferrireducens TaxID=2785058 RepID=A0ABR9ZTR3_9FIRM|nr:GspE/PulE family protein [Fusibacter ferrireducens]MBF4693854.1 type II/IV secretion system protein [Fusibacter ferrireducens]
MMKLKKRLGDVLVEDGIITREQLHAALDAQKITGGKLGDTLIKNKALTEELLYKVLESQYNIPYVDLNSIYIDPKVPKLIPESIASKHLLIPIKLEKGKLIVAMSDPLDVFAKDDIRIITGMQIESVIAVPNDIQRCIKRFYDVTETAENAVKEYNSQGQMDYEDVYEEDADVTNAPMVRLVNSIITQAVRSKASDIHIEPFDKYVRIRYRVDGDLREAMKPSKNTHSAIVTRIKIMGKMNISEKRTPQDGRVETTIEGIPIDMRISVLPTVYGEKIVIRLLDQSNLVVRKEDLGFTSTNLALFEKILKIPEGIILVTGPTGSGKTTTLYSVLKEMNSVQKNIITVEDPVEYKIEGINQVQVNNKAGLTFASGLRSILRQDPDVVMVGEVRDSETAQIAIRAAITGHVVLSTLHTNDTASTISRLVDMDVEKYLVSSAVKGIVSQRLVKKICAKCKTAYSPTVNEQKILKLESLNPVMLHRGMGCNACNHTGYSGRIAIHEVLVVDKDIRKCIAMDASTDEIQRVAQNNGLIPLNETCRELVLEGITTVDEMVKMTFNFDDN